MRQSGRRALARFHYAVVYGCLLPLCAAAMHVSRATAQGVNTHRVAGTVHDSIASAPLSGALVQLVSRSNPSWARSVSTGANGAFAFDSVPAGVYAIGYLHPRLDSLHIAPPLREMRLPGGDSLIRLVVPTVTSIARVACPGILLADDEALFIGRLRPAALGASASFGKVSVQWSETVIDRGLRQRRPTVTADTDSLGAFAICGLPVGTPLRVQGMSALGESGVVELQVSDARVLLRDLLTAPVDRVRIAANSIVGSPVGSTGDSADTQADEAAIDSLERKRGPGRLRGVVRSTEGAPLVGVRVRVRESLAEAVSDTAGRFDMRGLPLGTQSVEAVAIGYAPLRQAADITDADSARVVLIMSPMDVTLAPVKVFANRTVPAWRKEFDARRRQGTGRFVDEAAITRRNPMMVSDLLAGLPGVTIRTGLFASQSQLLLRDGTGGQCIPDVVVDGVLVDVTDLGIDAFVMASRLVGVEVYRSNILRPVEFQRQRSCGLIVLWTGERTAGRP